MNIDGKKPTSSWTRAKDLGLDGMRVSTDYYNSQAYFEAERDRVFARAWLAVARVEEVPANGDYTICEIPTLKANLLLVRGKDGVLRAFHNACSHRGVKLVCQQAGSAAAFSCPYHAWVYNLDGTIKGLPAATDFPDLDKQKDGLAPVHVGIWNGFIFVNLAKEPPQTLGEFLGETGARFADLPLQDYPYVTSISQDIDTNWKHISNAFTEGYHLGVLHKNTLPFVYDAANPHTDYFGVSFEGLHSAATIGRNGTWTPTEPVSKFVIEQAMHEASRYADSPGDQTSMLDHPSLNRDKIPFPMEEVINIFPNFQIQVLHDSYFWYTYWPMGPDKMRWEARLHKKRGPSSFRSEFAEASMMAASRDVMTEDSSMGRLQQIGLASGGRKEIILGENEFFLKKFLVTLDDYIAS